MLKMFLILTVVLVLIAECVMIVKFFALSKKQRQTPSEENEKALLKMDKISRNTHLIGLTAFAISIITGNLKW